MDKTKKGKAKKGKGRGKVRHSPVVKPPKKAIGKARLKENGKKGVKYH